MRAFCLHDGAFEGDLGSRMVSYSKEVALISVFSGRTFSAGMASGRALWGSVWCFYGGFLIALGTVSEWFQGVSSFPLWFLWFCDSWHLFHYVSTFTKNRLLLVL